MPIYEFNCAHCNSVFEILCKMDTKKGSCDKCGKESQNRVHTRFGHLMPSGTYRFGDTSGMSSKHWHVASQSYR